MNIDRQIRQWAQMILEESDDYQLDERTNPNGTIDDRSTEREIAETAATTIMSTTLMDYFYKRRYAKGFKPYDSFTSERLYGYKDKDVVQANLMISVFDMEDDDYLYPYPILYQRAQATQAMYGEHDNSIVSPEFDREFIKQLSDQLKGKVGIKNSHLFISDALMNKQLHVKFSDPNDLEDSDEYGIHEGRVWEFNIRFEKPTNSVAKNSERLANLVNKDKLSDLKSRMFRKNLKKPNLPQESKEIDEKHDKQIDDQTNLNEAEESPITMLFRTRPNVDDKAGKITFTSINEMKNFIESVGGEYSEQIADGFTQGKLMSIDLSQAIRQLAIQQQKKS